GGAPRESKERLRPCPPATRSRALRERHQRAGVGPREKVKKVDTAMLTGIIGRKVGMTQIFDADGTVHPATVLKAGPCVVVQAKTTQTDGYEAVQLGRVEEKPAKTNKPTTG